VLLSKSAQLVSLSAALTEIALLLLDEALQQYVFGQLPEQNVQYFLLNYQQTGFIIHSRFSLSSASMLARDEQTNKIIA